VVIENALHIMSALTKSLEDSPLKRSRIAADSMNGDLRRVIVNHCSTFAA